MSVHASPGVYALLLGAGMSRDAGVPTGWEIVSDLVRRAAVARGADEESAVADPEAWWARHGDGGPLGCSGLLEALGGTATARHGLLRGYFEPDEVERQDGRKQPGAAHHAAARLVAGGWVRVVPTTDFDRLTERALEAAGVQPQVVHSPDTLRGMTPSLSPGTVKMPASMYSRKLLSARVRSARTLPRTFFRWTGVIRSRCRSITSGRSAPAQVRWPVSRSRPTWRGSVSRMSRSTSPRSARRSRRTVRVGGPWRGYPVAGPVAPGRRSRTSRGRSETMIDHTPSQAEGEADDEDVRDMAEIEDLPLPGDPTPSQAEGEREEDEQDGPAV